MRDYADTPHGDPGPEELAMNEWLEDAGPYITLQEYPADPETADDGD